MPQASKIWQKVLKQMQQLPTVHQDDGSVPKGAAALDIHLHVLGPLDPCFTQSDRVSSSDWKKLVKELKVPFHLGQAVASATDPSTPRTYAGTSTLSLLLAKAVADGVISAASITSAAGSLHQSIISQLQQSGFTTALPQLLHAAAVALAGAQPEADPALTHAQQRSSHSQHATNPQTATLAGRVLSTQAAASTLLMLLVQCISLRSWLDQVDVAAVSVAALHAGAAALQHCSRWADSTSPNAPIPAVPGELLSAACSAVLAVCSAWDRPPGAAADQGAFAASCEHPAALKAVSMLLLVHTLSPSTASTASSAGSTPNASARHHDAAHVSTNQAAWQYACSHEPEISVLQQQLLQELGCSGRALLYAAHQLGLSDTGGAGIHPKTHNALLATVSACLSFAVHWGGPAQLQQVKQLAEALPQLKEGDSPPYSGHVQQCAPLLWLVPAVLLEWLQKQSADRLYTGLYQSVFSTLWFSFLEASKVHANYWSIMQSVFGTAAGGQQGNAVSSAFQGAARVAAGFSMCCQPPASLLVQLLHLTSRVDAYLMAYMQDAAGVPKLEGGSSGSAGDCPTSSSSNGSGAPIDIIGQSQDARQMQLTLLMLCQASNVLLEMLRAVLNTEKLAHSPADHYPSSSTFGSAVGPTAARHSEQQASLASLCAAMQQTLPQLASLTDAALRSLSGVDSKQHLLLYNGGRMLQELCDQGMFVAGGLQLVSPAVTPLSGLAFTLLKLVSGTLANPQVNEQDASCAISSLSVVTSFNSLVLQAACAGSSSASHNSSDAIISLLSHSKVSTGKWDAAQLSNLSDSRSLDDSGSSGSCCSEDGAVVLVPWLVSLGRCCLGYALVLQQSQADAATVWQAAAQSSQECIGIISQALQEVVSVLLAWLQSSSVSAQLAAAGYGTQRMTELLQSTAQDAALAQAGAAAASPAELLQELGRALMSLPMGTACNNPRCTSLAGLSEQQLVVGRARLCAGCRTARYCCRACQVAAWKQHKPACKAVASAHAAKAVE